MSTETFVAGPLGGWTQIGTSEGRTVRVEITTSHLTVVVDGDGSRAAVPYPSAGYGGHELLLSANETYLVMWLHSGQSEVGYELFQFRPTLEHLASFPYVFGEGFGPVFSADERLLALAWATNPGLYVEDHDLDDAGPTTSECVVEWATLRVQKLPTGPATTCRILVRLPAGSPAESDDTYYPTDLEISTSAEVRFHGDWGTRVRIPLPLPESVTVQGPDPNTRASTR